MPSQQVLQEKIKDFQEITQLLKRYKVIGIASLKKVRAAQLQEFRKKLAGKVYMRVIKNKLMERAINSSKERPNMQKLVEHLTGANIFLLTDVNPFRLALTLENEKIKVLKEIDFTRISHQFDDVQSTTMIIDQIRNYS